MPDKYPPVLLSRDQYERLSLQERMDYLQHLMRELERKLQETRKQVEQTKKLAEG
jgi:PHD/YefM family antitoxin component YafN of YafNO toxin-antitoxin module